ncbi:MULTISPECIES: DMT family transporter [unclassified Mesorhizobium]|uniref:DMT family transporter n=1 Tax=unclassified Mesorhizobium TaxID=325217 RepID=UPI000BAF533D|nr:MULTISPECIES: DMT family transporter [unclassified Mesorhizobium]TGT58722.1 DMT family transporter [Mesorhizobium sp. M00.F.Ca.ET.170.01.1.1]AZO12190.1 DMT family transporter [Mesorhizobium sp. M3A.F.Ca.ET.080.04.2.1]PBB84818.1 EamA family transporter [Mesorhizobium sp. WSM3876]RWB74904.1 MAG: DMT family transporter [Mesorhizobium sp.]RWB89635.1 MAG: DMT family transporter [Mesorhizobium sp.]
MTMTAGAAATRGPMTLKDWAQLLLLGAIWGGSFFFARIAVSEIHPLALVLLRVAIAAAALQLYLAIRGPSFRLALPHAGFFFLLGLANNVIPFSLIFAGQTQLGAGIASVLNSTTPFWTLILANALTVDEKLSWNKLAGIALGIAGTAVMIGPGLLAGLGGPVWAKFALIGASLSYAIALMIARRFRGVPSPVIATGQLTASTIIMIPLVLSALGPAGVLSASPPVWAAVLALALLSTAFAYILYFNLVASAGATNASLVTLIVPVSAMLLGFLFLGERLELFEMGGMALIGLGLITIDGRLLGRW